MPVLMVRMDATADDSLAAMRARSKFGIAIAAMIRMMATTISSSINEKPFCLRILCESLFLWKYFVGEFASFYWQIKQRILLTQYAGYRPILARDACILLNY